MMRTSEYYARGIYGFFVGYGLDAVERHHGGVKAAEVEPELSSGQPSPEESWDLDYDDDHESCQCAVSAYPPCSYCEPAD